MKMETNATELRMFATAASRVDALERVRLWMGMETPVSGAGAAATRKGRAARTTAGEKYIATVDRKAQMNDLGWMLEDQ